MIKRARQISFIFLIALLVFQLLLGLLFEKGYWVIWFNHYHAPFMDFFFKYWTYYGDGYIFLVLFIWFLLVRYKYAILLLILALSQTLIIQFLKRVIFKGSPRPAEFFSQEWNQFHPVDGVILNSWNSFPSGHTATAYTISVFLMFIVKNEFLRFTFILFAFLAGISRIYLLQHFMVDVAVGAIIASLLVIAIMNWVNKVSFFKSKKRYGGLLKN